MFQELHKGSFNNNGHRNRLMRRFDKIFQGKLTFVKNIREGR
ncbi:hypothetical protein HMPREF9093_00865 [Fusobacterium sp. oral taxon 370 str. F0437]|nr:hypothetical protein HMPREF9093_00865 [Fusobacterium sp. oral taxon 370 str. F0437]